MRGTLLRSPYYYTHKKNKSISNIFCLQTYYMRSYKMQIDKSRIIRVISIIDVISMFMILFYHSSNYIAAVTGYTMSNFVLFLDRHIVHIGMTTFTFSTGFKLVFNHYDDFADRHFYRKYLKKRSLFLIRIYVVYPILLSIFINAIYYIFKLGHYENLVQPIKNQVYNFDWKIFARYLFDGIPITAGQLWYIYVLLWINFIVILLTYIVGIKKVACVYPALIFYCLWNYHTLAAIEAKEMPYYITQYLVIYLSGYVLAVLYYKGDKQGFCAYIGGVILVFVLIVLDIVLRNTSLNIRENIIYRNVKQHLFLQYGLIAPVLLFVIAYWMSNRRIINLWIRLRKYTLAIYMLQYPILIPVFSFGLITAGYVNGKVKWGGNGGFNINNYIDHYYTKYI